MLDLDRVERATVGVQPGGHERARAAAIERAPDERPVGGEHERVLVLERLGVQGEADATFALVAVAGAAVVGEQKRAAFERLVVRSTRC